MKPTDNLFQLVKSLTGMEKRYFKVFAKRHVSGESTKYEALFDLYDAQPDDEQKFKTALKAKGLGKNLPDEKKNLQEMIMKAMRSYHSETTIDHQINDLLADEIFYKKKCLNDLRRKTIEKAKAMATKYDKYGAMLVLMDRETAMRIELEQDQLTEISDGLDDEEQELTEKIGAISRLGALSNWFFIQYRINANKHKGFWKKADAKMADPIFAAYEPGLCFRADIYYYKVHTLYALMKGDMVAHNKYSQLIYELYEVQYPQQKTDNRVGYKISLYNHLNSLMGVKDFAAVEKLLDHAIGVKPVDEDEAGEDFQNVVFYQQQLYINTGQFDRAAAHVPEILKGIKQYKKKINRARELTIYYNIALCYMILERWDEVIRYTEMLIIDKSEVKMEIKYASMLLQLIGYYETLNYDILTYQLRNTERLMKKREVCGEGEKIFFKMLHQLLRQGKGYLKDNRKQIESLLPALDAREEVQIWLASRLNGLSIRKVYESER